MLSLLLGLALAETPPVAAEMHARFQAAMQARNHVIQGDLERAKQQAQELLAVNTVPEGAPESWKAPIATISTHATALAAADDVGTAAAAMANIAGACGSCHGATNGGPGLEGMRGVPPQRWSEGDNMPLHLWAVDWMWLGLIGPSDEAWSRGAAELDSEPLARKFGADETTAKPMEDALYALAKKAATLGSDQHAERTAVVGELLSTCASCHVLRDKATPTPPKEP